MKSIKIGNLIFNKKALLQIVFCFFLNGIVIGAFVASTQKSLSSLLLIIAILFPYLFYWKSISKNIQEIK